MLLNPTILQVGNFRGLWFEIHLFVELLVGAGDPRC